MPSDATAQPAPATAPAVDEAAWDALVGRQVILEMSGGTLSGELLRAEGTSVVLAMSDGRVQTVPKANVTGVRLATAPSPAPSPSPAPAPAPAPATTAPAPASPAPGPTTAPAPATTTPAPAADPAAAPADPAATPAEGDPAAAEEEELSPGQQRRKERREKREHALLGAFTMHGATYSHWRDSGREPTAFNAGHASYAMDWGVGLNLSPGFGMYAVAGGLFGAKLRDELSGRTKANYGHVAALFAFGGKYYYSTVGAGVGFSRLRFADDTLHKDTGLAMPFKLVGKIPLPQKLYIGLGLTYELAMVRGFSRFVNAIGGQIVVGRW